MKKSYHHLQTKEVTSPMNFSFCLCEVGMKRLFWDKLKEYPYDQACWLTNPVLYRCQQFHNRCYRRGNGEQGQVKAPSFDRHPFKHFLSNEIYPDTKHSSIHVFIHSTLHWSIACYIHDSVGMRSACEEEWKNCHQSSRVITVSFPLSFLFP